VAVEYRDDVLILSKLKFKIRHSGVKLNDISSFFFDYLNVYNIPTGYKKKFQNNSFLLVKHERFPFCVKVLNTVNRRMGKLFGKKPGESLSHPVLEFHFGYSGGNLISENYLTAFNLCTFDDIKTIKRICTKTNAVLKSFFERRDSILTEFICVFGKDEERIFLIDDFSPESLKVIPQNADIKKMNPFDIRSIVEHKNYLDYIYNLTKN